MAYVPQQQDDEDKRKLEAGGGELGSFGSTQGAAAPTAPKFVNVADYLSKNQEGSANIANAASGKLEQQRDEAGNLATGAGQKFNTAVSAGTTNLDQSVLDSALSKPEDFVKGEGNTAKFLAMRDAAYKGPMSIQNTDSFAPAQSKVSALGTTATGIGTEEGRNALVSSLSDHPTQGKTSLNQLLLQGNPEAAKKIQDTAGTFKSVEDQWNQILANAPSAVDSARATTDATRATIQSRLGDTTSQFKTGLTDKLSRATNERDAFNQDFTGIDTALNGNPSGLDLRPDQLEKLGLTDAYPYLSKLNDFNQQLGHYSGPVPLSTYVSDRGSANTNVPTIGGVANPDDYAREAALQQLSGKDFGLSDTPETTYTPNGRLPGGIDYMGAFGKAGSTLHGNELEFLNNLSSEYPQPGADSSEFYSKYYPATTHVPGAEWNSTGGPANADYYTTPGAATAPQGNPYPVPTSPSPGAGYTWNPVLGTWLAPGEQGPRPGGPGAPRPGFGG